jgi:two-component system, OmpR family, sensor kinase
VSRRLSLRVRLLLVTLALVAVALAAAGWATHVALRAFLIDRVDGDLRDARVPALRFVTSAGLGGPGGGGRFAPAGLPEDTVVQLRTPAGILTRDNRRDAGDAAVSLPASVAAGYSTVDLPGSPGQYRVLSTSGADDADGPPGSGDPVVPRDTLIVAVPLSDVNGTLTRLLFIELAVGGATLAGLAVLALWLVRLGLRPLARIERTADAYAAGDLTARVADDDPRTEVGRLGRTLNAMLGRIEQSFEERHEAERRLRRFVADASHELQTPLTSVRGYAELFRRGAAQRPEDLATTMRRIEAEAARMGVLVDDLLLLARLDQGRPLDRERIDLAALAAELAADARVVEPERPIDTECDTPVVVEGDDVRLRQVVGNLLSNARAHTPPEARVVVRVAERGGEAVLEVADSGPGLAAGHAERVFERFFRADPSRARASGGSGLGLSIVAAIAEAHGGRAEVESEPGAGALFRVVLPLAGGGEGAASGGGDGAASGGP